MSNDALSRILRESGEDLLDILANRLTPTDLQTLMLEVYRLRATRQTPNKLLEQHEESRFVRPSPLDPRVFLEFDRLAFQIAAPMFQPIELSPLSPLGSTSAITTVSQNNLVSTARNTEVMADPTNAMALECAVRRKALLRSPNKAERVRLCCSHRLVRSQAINAPKAWAHFKLFGLCSAGKDEGSYDFEMEELTNHIGYHLCLLKAWIHGSYTLRVVVSNFAGPPLEQPLATLIAQLQGSFRDVIVQLDTERSTGRGYYLAACFQIFLTDEKGEESFLVDGGITDWTQKLLSNQKERFVISGIGTERLCSLFPPSSEG